MVFSKYLSLNYKFERTENGMYCSYWLSLSTKAPKRSWPSILGTPISSNVRLNGNDIPEVSLWCTVNQLQPWEPMEVAMRYGTAVNPAKAQTTLSSEQCHSFLGNDPFFLLTSH